MKTYTRKNQNMSLHALTNILDKVEAGGFDHDSLAANLKFLTDLLYIISGFAGINNAQELAEYEIQLIEAKHKLQKVILEQLKKEDYAKVPLKECWNHFLFANSLQYGDISTNTRLSWYGMELAGDAKNLICNVMIGKIQVILRESPQEENDAFGAAYGMLTHYGEGSTHYQAAQTIIESYDADGKFKDKAWQE